MLKIYNAWANSDQIVVDDFIEFDYGKFDTGVDGFGVVKASISNKEKANYLLQSLEAFKEYLESVKTYDGRVESLIFWNPVSYERLADMYENAVRTDEFFQNYNLNEEGILLFTDYVRLKYKDNLTQKLFGRTPGTGLYLLKPNASVSMYVRSGQKEYYEAIQSQNLGKRLVLAKMDRKI